MVGIALVVIRVLAIVERDFVIAVELDRLAEVGERLVGLAFIAVGEARLLSATKSRGSNLSAAVRSAMARSLSPRSP
jgi:hypothetical protein